MAEVGSKEKKKLPEICINTARVRRVLELTANRKIIEKRIPYKKIRSDYKYAEKCLNNGMELMERTSNDDETKTEIIDIELTSARRAEFEEYKNNYETKVKENNDIEIDLLSKARTRFNCEVSEYLAITLDEMARQLCLQAIDHVLINGKKIIHPQHLHTEGIENIPLYKLFCTLPTWVEGQNDAQKERVKEEETDNNKTDDDGDVDPSDVDPSDIDPSDLDDSFKTYVGNRIKKTQQSREQYASIRVSRQIKSYISKLLVEFCQRFFIKAYMAVKYKKQKTVDGETFMYIIRDILYDGIVPDMELLEHTETMHRSPTEEEKAKGIKKKNCPTYENKFYEIDLHFESDAFEDLYKLIEYYRSEKIKNEEDDKKKKYEVHKERGTLYEDMEVPVRAFLSDVVLSIDIKPKAVKKVATTVNVKEPDTVNESDAIKSPAKRSPRNPSTKPPVKKTLAKEEQKVEPTIVTNETNETNVTNVTNVTNGTVTPKTPKPPTTKQSTPKPPTPKSSTPKPPTPKPSTPKPPTRVGGKK